MQRDQLCKYCTNEGCTSTMGWTRLNFEVLVRRLYTSPHNPQVEGVVATLQQHFPGMVLGAEHAHAASVWLLFLSADSFKGDRGQQLVGELQAKLTRRDDECALLMVYDPMANPFSDIINETRAHALGLWQLRLFDSLAIEWHTNPLGKVSVQLVAQKLGARRWSLWEPSRAEPKRNARGWSNRFLSGRQTALRRLVHQGTYQDRLVELPVNAGVDRKELHSQRT